MTSAYTHGIKKKKKKKWYWNVLIMRPQGIPPRPTDYHSHRAAIILATRADVHDAFFELGVSAPTKFYQNLSSLSRGRPKC